MYREHTNRKIKLPTSIIKSTDRVRSNYGIIRVIQSSFLVSFRMSCTHSIVSSSNILPETSSSRSLGEMATTQLLVSSMTNILNEFSISLDIRVVQVCRSCRKITMICECLNGPKQAHRMRISNRLLNFALSTYIAHKTRVLFG